MSKLLFLLLFFPFCLCAQTSIPEREAEAHAALIHFEANPATQNYDLKYSRLAFNIDPQEAYISGTVTHYFEPLQELTQVVFELKANMEVNQVLYHGNSLSFTHDSDNLSIDLPEPLAAGTLDSVAISYSGAPANGGFGYFAQSEHSGNEIVWTLSEPYGAKYWWPTKQDLNDKIDSVDIYITYPHYNSQNHENLGVSNGLMVSDTVIDNMRTTHYHHGHPIPAYLIGVAVSDYVVYTAQVPNNGNPFPVINYVYPEDEQFIQGQTSATPDYIAFYSEKFGEYPYADEKYGHCQFGWGGGMEHTTVSFMGGFGQELIAHELGHQWFGDDVTCAGWQNVWLNEGFANFMYALVREQFNSENSYRNWRISTVNSITSQPGGAVYVPEDQLDNVSRIFSSRLTYNKGGMVLDMLRRKLGDEDFFQACRNYLHNPDYAYGYATTEDFKNELEAESGLDLTQFFDQWIYGQGYPSYHADWYQDDDLQVHLTLSQTQSKPDVTDFFYGDVPLRLQGSGSQSLDTVVVQTGNHQQFTLPVNFTVNQVSIDPDTKVISKNNSATLGLVSSHFSRVKVYPNPAANVFHIQSQHPLSRYVLHDLQGRTVQKGSLQTPTINIASLKTGIYFLKVTDEQGNVKHTKVVKE